jgi:hypothetical protein
MTNFYDDFSSGGTSNWPTVTGTAAVVNGNWYGASRPLLHIAPAGAACNVASSTTKWTQGVSTWAHMKMRFRMNALPSTSTADLFTIQAQTQLDNFDFFYDTATGTFRFDLKGASAYLDTGIKPILGYWHELQAKVYYGATTYTAQVMLDAYTSSVLSSPGETSSFVRSLHIGPGSAKTYSFDVAVATINVGTSEPTFEETLTMGKSSGLGDNFYVGGYNLSGDSGAIATSCPMGPLSVTDITQSAYERRGGRRDGAMQWNGYLNDAAGRAHPIFSALPRTDVLVSYFRGTTVGKHAASMIAKQVNYDPTLGADSSLDFVVNAVANGYAMEWGKMGTAGVRTDTGATSGTSIDNGAASTTGLQAYLHKFSFTGTDVTVKIQQSSDNGAGDAFTDVTGGGFTQITTGTPGYERIATSASLALEQYLRVVTVTTGGFSSFAFAVVICRNSVTPAF